MESPEARITAASAIPGVIEDEARILTQSLVRPAKQSEKRRKSTDLGGSSMEKNAGSHESQLDSGEPTRRDVSLQNVLLSEQQVTDSDAALGSFNDLSTITATDGPAALDKEVVRAQKYPRVSTFPPERVSLTEGNTNVDMQTAASVDSCQLHTDGGDLKAKVSGRAVRSNKASAERDTTTVILRRGVLPMDLQGALLSSSQAFEEEKQREEYSLALISSCLENVSSKSSDLKSSAVDLLGECETVDDLDGSTRFDNALFREEVDRLEQRLNTIEDYVRGVYAEAFKQMDANVPDCERKTQQQPGFATSKARHKLISSSMVKKGVYLTSGKNRTDRSQNYRKLSDNHRCNHLLLHVLQFAVDVRNVTVRQHQMLCKLNAIGEVYVYKIEVSCRIVLNAVKSVANVVRPALEATKMAQRAVGRVDDPRSPTTGRSLSPADHDVTQSLRWIHFALSDAETSVRMHGEAVLVLKEARKHLGSLKHNESVGRDVLRQTSAFERYIVDLVRQPSNINFDELRETQITITFLKDMLSPILDEMKECPTVILNLSERSSNVVRNVLDSLSVATHCSCIAIETSQDTLNKLGSEYRGSKTWVLVYSMTAKN